MEQEMGEIQPVAFQSRRIRTSHITYARVGLSTSLQQNRAQLAAHCLIAITV